MSRHLKNIIISRLQDSVATFVDLPANATPHTKGVHYFCTVEDVKCLWGAMNTMEEGRKRRKHIIVRPSRFRRGLFELYTYHFPKHWSDACIENRELIKLAQRKAHALEHDYSPEALEWRLRFFTHYFRVVRGGADPEPGMKRYSRFYQYTYVALYRELQAARKAAQEPDINIDEISANDISFEPVVRPLYTRRSYPLTALLHYQEPESNLVLQPRGYLIC
jgi:hypothetical protein